jgi:hypothetical protein
MVWVKHCHLSGYCSLGTLTSKASMLQRMMSSTCHCVVLPRWEVASQGVDTGWILYSFWCGMQLAAAVLRQLTSLTAL